ncbi:MAG TPA: hypothetical protein VFN10_22720 [Thermoanaerobaculia bacterium]|nr:hypothetical protein [Thermoanaerobaculia bacterium]
MRALRLVLLVVLVAGCASEAKRDAALDASVTRELARLDRDLKVAEANGLPSFLVPLAKRHRAALDEVRASASPELKLYRLRDPFIGIETLRFVASHGAASQNLAAFESVWNDERRTFDAIEPVHGTALRRALYQSAANRGRVLALASLPYGRTSAPGEGLFYLAEAEGNRLFAHFVASLDDTSVGDEPAATRGAIATAADALERETLAAYDRQPTGKTTIPVSVRLKESRELLARGWADGAALLLLEARLELSRRNGGTTHATASAPRHDGSFASLLGELSRDQKSGQIVSADVVPLFDSLFDAGSGADAIPFKAPVVVTLVRWPYT